MKTTLSKEFNVWVAFIAALLIAATPGRAAIKTWHHSPTRILDWSYDRNWTPSGAPEDGDDLIFPSGTALAVSTNDLIDLQVRSITVEGNYTLRGNPIRLTGGITATHASGLALIDF